MIQYGIDAIGAEAAPTPQTPFWTSVAAGFFVLTAVKVGVLLFALSRRR